MHSTKDYHTTDTQNHINKSHKNNTVLPKRHIHKKATHDYMIQFIYR